AAAARLRGLLRTDGERAAAARVRRRRARTPPRRREPDRGRDVAARRRSHLARVVPGVQRRVGSRGAARRASASAARREERRGRRSSPLTAVTQRQLVVQVTLLDETTPSVVGEPNVQLTVRTVVPGGCSTVSVALVNATS